MEKLRVGIIGLGCRGYSLMRDVILRMQDVEVTAVCDEYKDRVQAASNLQRKQAVSCPWRQLMCRRYWTAPWLTLWL